jgi:hypothetical protein
MSLRRFGRGIRSSGSIRVAPAPSPPDWTLYGTDNFADVPTCQKLIREGRRWRRQSERVDEICWNPREIRHALRASGFDQVRAWDAAAFFGRESVVGPGCRTVYLARKALTATR